MSKQTPLYENTIDSILQRVVDEARKLSYFHHSINRQLAEQFLTLDGDFLIRDSSVDLVPEKKLKNICLSGIFMRALSNSILLTYFSS